MIKYQAKTQDGKLLSEWLSDFAGADYYEENWGKPEHWHQPSVKELPPEKFLNTRIVDSGLIDINKEPIMVTEYLIASAFIVESEDITREVNAREQKEKEKKELAEQLEKVDVLQVKTFEQLLELVAKMHKHIFPNATRADVGTIEAAPAEIQGPRV